jgi:hypothetical protein
VVGDPAKIAKLLEIHGASNYACGLSYDNKQLFFQILEPAYVVIRQAGTPDHSPAVQTAVAVGPS